MNYNAEKRSDFISRLNNTTKSPEQKENEEIAEARAEQFKIARDVMEMVSMGQFTREQLPMSVKIKMLLPEDNKEIVLDDDELKILERISLTANKEILEYFSRDKMQKLIYDLKTTIQNASKKAIYNIPELLEEIKKKELEEMQK